MDLRWLVPITWGLILTGLVLWVWFQQGEHDQRIDRLEVDRDRHADTLDALEAAIWPDDEQPQTPQEPAESPYKRLEALDGTPTDPHAPAQRLTAPLSGTEHDPDPGTIDADYSSARSGLPPVPPTVQASAVKPTVFEPDPEPQTQPALERRRGGATAGRWVEGPGGSLVYQPPTKGR